MDYFWGRKFTFGKQRKLLKLEPVPCRPDLMQGAEGGSAGPLRCGKGSTWEGGVRVPAIAHWLGKISHRRSMQLALHLDLFPTILKMAGGKLPKDRKIDGIDISNSLLRKSKVLSTIVELVIFKAPEEVFMEPYFI